MSHGATAPNYNTISGCRLPYPEISFGVGLCGFRTVLRADYARVSHRLRAPRRGARGLPRAGASAAVERNRPCRRNSPPMPVRAACLRQTATDAGLRRCFIPHFCRAEESGGHCVQTKPKTHCHKRKTPVFTQTFIRKRKTLSSTLLKGFGVCQGPFPKGP